MPLLDLIRKDATFKWSDKAEVAFQKLKKMFVSAPILVMFDYNQETIVEVDASK